MATATVTLNHQPMGLVVRDGGEDHSHPRILMWYWSDEKGADDVEHRDH